MGKSSWKGERVELEKHDELVSMINIMTLKSDNANQLKEKLGEISTKLFHVVGRDDETIQFSQYIAELRVENSVYRRRGSLFLTNERIIIIGGLKDVRIGSMREGNHIVIDYEPELKGKSTYADWLEYNKIEMLQESRDKDYIIRLSYKTKFLDKTHRKSTSSCYIILDLFSKETRDIIAEKLSVLTGIPFQLEEPRLRLKDLLSLTPSDLESLDRSTDRMKKDLLEKSDKEEEME